MEQFLGLSRDASREKAEPGTSPYNKNIVYDKQLGSITQENGFIHSHFIKGVLIGQYSTNTHVVYITYDVETGNNIISYINTATNQVSEVVNTQYFGYEVTRPIEVIAWYNYNQDLIIMFSDGVFEKSSAPRIINLMDISSSLDVNKEFINERFADNTYLFSPIKQPIYNVSYGDKAFHGCDVVFFTIAYVLPDKTTTTKYINSLAEGFPLYGFNLQLRRELTFTAEGLDPFFTQAVVGIVAYKDNGFFGFTTNPIDYVDGTLTYTFNTTEGLNSVAVDEILVESLIFEKVKALTIGNDAIIAGGIVTKPSNVYQKYANNIKLNLYFDARYNNRHHAPLLCPDEVYYMTIALAFGNGTFSDEFHIPGEDPVASDLTPIDKTALGLTNLSEPNIASFRIINKGSWVDETVAPPDFNSLVDTKLKWGYWQNEELYPDSEQYNGTVDYDGVTVIPGGRDLRGTNVKLHRVPGLDNLSKKFPCRVGIDMINDPNPTAFYKNKLPAFSLDVENFMEAFGSVIESDNIVGYRLSFVKKDANSKIVSDINYLKPLCSNTDMFLFDDTSVIFDHQITFEEGDPVSISQGEPKLNQFGFSKVKSVNQSLYKGGVTARIVKANYGVFTNRLYNKSDDGDARNEERYIPYTVEGQTAGSIGDNSFPEYPADNMLRSTFLIPSVNNQYGVIQSVEQTPGNVYSYNTTFIHEMIKLRVKNSHTTHHPDYGWNPLQYNPTGIGDTTTVCTLPMFRHDTFTYAPHDVVYNDLTKATISASFIALHTNIHQGLRPTDFVVIGVTNIEKPKQLFKDFGDVFTSNVYSEITEMLFKDFRSDRDKYDVYYFQTAYSGMIGMDNNTLIYFQKNMEFGVHYETTGDGNNVDQLNSFNYTLQNINKPASKTLNSILASVAFDFNKKHINSFPYRIIKSLTLQSENLSTINVRTFPATSYYDLPSLRGELIYLVGFDKGVYCQQRYSLSVFKLKERLDDNNENSAYLVETDLFAYKPQTIVDEDNKGYIGSVHQFGKKLSKDGLVTVDAERGKIYLIAGITPKELSKVKMVNYFKNLLTPLTEYIIPNIFNAFAVADNPYNGNGILIGIDDKTNRILVRINNYIINNGIDIIDGIPYMDDKPIDIKASAISVDKGATLSFNLDWSRWISEHDYKAQFFINTNKINYAGINIYENSLGSTAEYKNKLHVYITNKVVPTFSNLGKYFYLTDTTIYESFTDLLFNTRYDLDKWYKSVMWRTTARNIDGKRLRDKTISAIILYTDYQCTEKILLDPDVVSLVRNPEGAWTFNSFRDMIKDSSDLPIGENGTFDANKVHLSRTWFDKSDFINNFIIVRLIMSNINNIQVSIHNVNVESRNSDRI